MNKIDCTTSKPNVTFGIAFRPYTNQRGVRTADAIDLFEEIKMYKSITDKLKKDSFVKTEKGLKTDSYKIEKDDSFGAQSMRYYDESGEYYFHDDGTKLQNVDKYFKAMRSAFDKIFNK